jgi:hypothetical protein
MTPLLVWSTLMLFLSFVGEKWSSFISSSWTPGDTLPRATNGYHFVLSLTCAITFLLRGHGRRNRFEKLEKASDDLM